MGRTALTVAALAIGLLLSACGKSGLNPAEEAASERWRTGRQTKEFIHIKDTYCGPGTKGTRVRILLGAPLTVARREDGTEYWAYVKIDPTVGNYEAWGCEVSVDGDVVRWLRKGAL